MKNFKLFFAVALFSAVTNMSFAADATPAPTPAPAESKGFMDTLKGYVNTAAEYTVYPVSNALQPADDAFNNYVVKNVNDYAYTPAVNFVKGAAARPVASMVVCAAAYAAYYAYDMYSESNDKKAKN